MMVKQKTQDGAVSSLKIWELDVKSREQSIHRRTKETNLGYKAVEHFFSIIYKLSGM